MPFLAGPEIRLFASKNAPIRWEPRTFPEHLLYRRQTAGLTQTEAAVRVGVALTAFNAWEQGQRVPRRWLWGKLAAFLGMDEETFSRLPNVSEVDAGVLPPSKALRCRAVEGMI